MYIYIYIALYILYIYIYYWLSLYVLYKYCLHTHTHTHSQIHRFLTRPSPLVNIKPHLLDQIPGQLNNRKTIMGELNWIFTAITDTIAWNILPPDLFQRLFRQVSRGGEIN